MLQREWRIRRLLVRSAGQVTVSVLATLAATAIYGALRHGYGEIAGPAASGIAAGKLQTRVDGASSPPFEPPASRLPILSVINWTAPDSPATLGADRGSFPAAVRLARPSHSRPTRRAETVAVVQPPARPPAETVTTPAPTRTEVNPVWRMAAGAVDKAGTALGTAGGAATAAARGAVSLGGALLGRLIP